MVRVGRRTVRRRLRIPASRTRRAVTLRLRATERRRLAHTRRLVLRITLVAQDTHGNTSRRTLRLRLRATG